MSIRPGIRDFFRLPAFTRRLRRREVDDEIDTHLELRVERLRRSGLTEDAARAEAARMFGSVESRDQLYEAASSREVRMQFHSRLDAMWHDLVFAARQLRRAPAFTVAAVATLALGLGANATMFGTIDRLLFRPPAHVTDASRVYTVSVRSLFGGKPDVQSQQSWWTYKDMVRSNAFQHVGAYAPLALTLGEGASARRVRGMRATASYFLALGVRPMVGRFFSDDEAAGAPAATVAIVSESFWRRELDASPAVPGLTIPLAGIRYQVIGVAPDGFTGVGQNAVDVWIPMMVATSPDLYKAYQEIRQWYWLRIVARMKPGAVPAVAVEMATSILRAGMAADGVTSEQLARRRPTVELRSILPRYARGETRDAKAALLIGGVSLLVLILACANVANLQLARAMRRQHEIAVRLAIGISRGRLIAQLLVESALLAVLGGGAALGIAWWAGEMVRRTLLGGVDWPYAPVDGRIIVYTLGMSLATGLLTGLLPALRMSNSSIASTLVQGPRTSHGGRSRERFALLVLQSALTVILLVGTGLFVRSLLRIESMPTGIEVDRVLVASLNTAGRGFAAKDIDEMYARLHEAVVRLPEVESASLVFTVPFGGSVSAEVRLPGRDSLPLTAEGGPYFNPVSPEYFATLGTRIVRGRTFTAAEIGRMPVAAAIVNQTAARLWWPNADPIGQCMYIGDSAKACVPIIGVAEDTRRQAIVEDETVQFYVPAGAFYGPRNMLIRTRGNPGAVAATVRRQLQNVLPASPYVDVTPLAQSLSSEIRPWRLGATMFGAFGVLALVLAAVGLYGVLAYDVAQRTREMGVRLALGAHPASVARLVVQRGLRTVLAGGAIGFVVALAARGVVGPLLFRTSPSDPLVFGVAAIVVVTMGTVSTLLPARRAARVDPAVSLRAE